MLEVHFLAHRGLCKPLILNLKTPKAVYILLTASCFQDDFLEDLIDLQPLAMLHTLKLEFFKEHLRLGIENGQEVAENLATKGGINKATMFVPTR